MHANYDVVVVGAGPAGTSAAIRMAQVGLSVAILERCHFPRRHVGICISDHTVAAIDFLGLGPEFANAQFWRRKITAVLWEQSEVQMVDRFGYHLDRAVFDQLLLNRALAVGVHVYQPARFIDSERADAGWRIAIDFNGSNLILTSRFVVDAAGRRGFRHTHRTKDGPPLIAIHATWSVGKTPGYEGLIEAGDHGWLWYAQTAIDRALVSIFYDPRGIEGRKNFSLRETYTAFLRQFQAFRPEQCHGFSETQACDATSQHADDPIGDGYIRVGDSCLSVDPLSSQGVHLALQAGMQSAVVVNTILRKPANGDIARHFYRLRATEQTKRYSLRTRREYARTALKRQTSFWLDRVGDETEDRSIPTAREMGTTFQLELGPMTVSDATVFDAEPAMVGSFVEVRRVVRHPNFESPVAYFGGADLVILLSIIPITFFLRDLPTHWKYYVSAGDAQSIATSLFHRRVFVPV
jgi:flavin-dependent dehydrogenase